MARSFDPTAGADSITFSVGASPPDQGPITIAILAKSASVAGYTGWLISGRKSGSGIWGFLTSNNVGPKLFAENDFGSGVSGLSTSWRWYVMTKATGSAIPRIHVWDLSTAWTHTDDSATVADGTGPIDTLILGSNGTNGWRGSIAVAATWASVLTDAQIEATMTLNASDTFAASPAWMVRLNQASIATAVPDDTGGGGSQSAITGTTVDSSDPAGYNYALTASSTVSPAGIAVPVATGTPTVNQSLSVSPSGVAVPAATGTPTVNQSLSVSPSGIAVPVATGTPTVQMVVSPTGIAVPVATGSPTVTSSAPPPAPAKQGSWWQLLGILDQARVMRRQDATIGFSGHLSCPNDGEPLSVSAGGIVYCRFDGWMPDGRYVDDYLQQTGMIRHTDRGHGE